MTIVQSIIIAIVEGITEFIPISSTAHMRITENILGISNTDEFTKVFTIAIQLGAILSVVVLYRKKFFDVSRAGFYIKLGIAVIPSLVIGLLFKQFIDRVLENPTFIAIIMLAGGVVLLFVDNWFKKSLIHREGEITRMKALQIGMYQCLAIILPGLSRSAATIIGGMRLKLDRSLAAEFSFLLAVPTMLAATVYSLYKHIKEYGTFSAHQLQLLASGNIIAFFVAILAIKFFITALKKYGFRIWGIYRVVLGIALLIMIYTGFLKS
jgi:undecaprenyl-diphosphatase